MNNNNENNVEATEEISKVTEVTKEAVSLITQISAGLTGDWKKTAKQTMAVCFLLLLVYTGVAGFGHYVAERVIEKKWAEVSVLDRAIEKLSLQVERANLVIQEGEKVEKALGTGKRDVAALQREQEQMKEILSMGVDTLKGMQKQLGEKTDELVSKACELTEAEVQLKSVRSELVKMIGQRAEMAATIVANAAAVDKAKEVQDSLATAENQLVAKQAELDGLNSAIASAKEEKAKLEKPVVKPVVKEESFTSKVSRSFAAMQSAWGTK